MTAGVDKWGGREGRGGQRGERGTRDTAFGETLPACEPTSVREQTASDSPGIHSVCGGTREEVIDSEVPVTMSHLGVVLRDEQLSAARLRVQNNA